MKGIRVHEFGGVDALTYEQVGWPRRLLAKWSYASNAAGVAAVVTVSSDVARAPAKAPQPSSSWPLMVGCAGSRTASPAYAALAAVEIWHL
jgi:hypothetical protein